MFRYHWMNALCLVLCIGAVLAHGEEAAPSPEDPGAVLLDLREAQQRALADNPSLQAVEALVAQARQRVFQAASAYLPNLSLSYVGTETDFSNATVDSARAAAMTQAQNSGGYPWLAREMVPTDAENYQLSVTLRYLLFDGFGRHFQLQAAKAGRKESEAGLQEARRQLCAALARSYYGVQLARENIGIALADEAFNQRLLEDAKAQQREGAGSLSNVLNFEVLLRGARAQLLSARRDYDTARIGLAVLMGQPDATLGAEVRLASLSEESSEDMSLPAIEKSMDNALENRPDLSRFRHALRRNKAALKGQYATFSPTVSLFSSRDAQRSDSSDFEGDDFSQTTGINVSYDIFTGGRRWARVREAKHARREAEWRLDDAVLNALGEVRAAVTSIETAQEQVKLQRATAEYVEHNRDLVKLGYAGGVDSLALLNQAQRNFVEAQGRHALARVSLRNAWFTLRTATGESLALLPQE
jgi:outer membrane protein TolC